MICAIFCAALSLSGSAIARVVKGSDPGGGAGNSIITTATIKNNSRSTWTAGHVYIGGQGFRRGDIPPGTFPAIRDARTHTPLVYQWDEIATRNVNGDEGSWRHAVYSIQLPSGIAANSTYQIEFVRQTGAYSVSAKQTLAALAAAHDLKIRFTDFRNQDGSVRGSGKFTFAVNANIKNAGVDAPRKCATGPVRDCWIVSGIPVDDVGGAPDTELYVQFYLDLTTSSSDQTSLGDVRYVPAVMSPWQNNPNPYQDLSYYPQVLDGAHVVLDWSNLNKMVASADNPVNVKDGLITAPSSIGPNSLYIGHALLYHTMGTPIGGLANNTLYWSWVYSQKRQTPQELYLMKNPSIARGGGQSFLKVGSQGSGQHHFDFRLWHPRLMRWYALDTSARENWTSGAAGRYTSPLDPAFTTAEQKYWEASGSMPPVQTGQSHVNTNLLAGNADGLTPYYNPLSRCNIVGGDGTGARPDIGLITEWMSQAFLLEDAASWSAARLFSTCFGHYQFAWMLSEATHRIIPLNNGPLTAKGNGGGGNYPVLGAPQPDIFLMDLGPNYNGVAPGLQNTPDASFNGYGGGQWGTARSYGPDHEPAFTNGAYQIFGSRHLLDDLYMHANRAMLNSRPYGEHYRSFTLPSNGLTYYSKWPPSLESRAGYWSYRDKMLGAAFGADNNPERPYFSDILQENNNFWVVYQPWKDGPDSTGYTDALTMMKFEPYSEGFMDAMAMVVFYQAYVLMHDPLSQNGMVRARRLLDALFSEKQPNSMSSYWGPLYYYTDQKAFPDKVNGEDGGLLFGPAVGHLFGGSSAYYIGTPFSTWTFDLAAGSTATNSGTITDKGPNSSIPPFTYTRGDRLLVQWGLGVNRPNELADGTWYKIINFNNTNHNFQLENPATPGVAFPRFTFAAGNKAGSPNQFFTVHLNYAPPTSAGWWHDTYVPDLRAGVVACLAAGFKTNMNEALKNIEARGVPMNGQNTKLIWDPTITVP